MEELAVAGRSTGLPTQKQVIELLDGEFVRAGYEIDDVVIDSRPRPPRITVIADGDKPLDLDTVAALSRSASALLDDLIAGDDAYVLEVTSPGGGPTVDRREAFPSRARPPRRRRARRRNHGHRPVGHRVR